MDIKVQPISSEGLEDLATKLEKIFIEDWGGPKSALALAYLRETVIPELVYSLQVNWRYLDNSTFREIMVTKLNSQFAYPQTFAEGLAVDILLCAKSVLGKSPLANNHPWQPWEIILRMLTIGFRLPEITQYTGYPEAYLERFRKQYCQFQQVVQGVPNISEDQLFKHKELSGLPINQIRLLIDFYNRFKIFKNYYERLQAEQIIMDLALDLDPDSLIRLFEGLFEVERQVTPQRFVDLLKGAKVPWLTGDNYFTNSCAYGMFSHWPKKQITALLDRLMEVNLLVDDTSLGNGLTLSERAAKIIVPLVVPKLVDEVQRILRSKARDRISQTIAILQGRNPEITVQIIGELVLRQDTSVVICFKALKKRVPKKVFLQIIWACGKLGGKDAVSLLSKSINDRDSLIRVRTCQAMGELADPAFYFILIATLSDQVALVRENAVRALGKLKMISVLKHLEKIINNPAEEPQVQRAARETRAALLKEKDI